MHRSTDELLAHRRAGSKKVTDSREAARARTTAVTQLRKDLRAEMIQKRRNAGPAEDAATCDKPAECSDLPAELSIEHMPIYVAGVLLLCSRGIRPRVHLLWWWWSSWDLRATD